MVQAWSLKQLATELNLRPQGKDVSVTALVSVQNAGPSDLTFLQHVRTYPPENLRAGITIVPENIASRVPGSALVAKNGAEVYIAYAKASGLVQPEPELRVTYIDPTAEVHPDATLEQGVVIGAGTTVAAGVRLGAGVTVGSGCELHFNCVLYPHVRLGDRVIVQANTCIGGDGFGFAPSPEGWHKIHHHGSVEIHDDVEVGANCTIDRGNLDSTIIGSGTKLDAQVHIGHNCEIGKNVVFAGKCGVGGSTVVGDWTRVGGGTIIINGITIGKGVQVNSTSAVFRKRVRDGESVAGIPAYPVEQWRRASAAQPKISDALIRLGALEKKLAKLEGEEQ